MPLLVHNTQHKHRMLNASTYIRPLVTENSDLLVEVREGGLEQLCEVFLHVEHVAACASLYTGAQRHCNLAQFHQAEHVGKDRRLQRQACTHNSTTVYIS